MTEPIVILLLIAIPLSGLALGALRTMVRWGDYYRFREALQDFALANELHLTEKVLSSITLMGTHQGRDVKLEVYRNRNTRQHIRYLRVVMVIKAPNNILLRLRTRDRMGSLKDIPDRWTEDARFDMYYVFASSPENLAGKVFNPRESLRDRLRALRLSGEPFTQFTIEVVNGQLIFDQLHPVPDSHHIDSLVEILCDLANAVEETAAYLFQSEAEQRTRAVLQ